MKPFNTFINESKESDTRKALKRTFGDKFGKNKKAYPKVWKKMPALSKLLKVKLEEEVNHKAAKNVFESSEIALEEEKNGAGMSFKDAIAHAEKHGHKVTYGTASMKWHSIGKDDRDYHTSFALHPDEAKRVGMAKSLLLSTQARKLEEGKGFHSVEDSAKHHGYWFAGNDRGGSYHYRHDSGHEIVELDDPNGEWHHLMPHHRTEHGGPDFSRGSKGYGGYALDKHLESVHKKLEETEQLDELKKSTLASYTKKAVKQIPGLTYHASEGWGKSVDKAAKRVDTRVKGVSRAADKLANLDETAEVAFHEGESPTYKVGDKVIAKIGPHKGAVHTVIHVHPTGHVNITPLHAVGRANRYHLGAAKANPTDIEHYVSALHEDAESNYARETKRIEANQKKWENRRKRWDAWKKTQVKPAAGTQPIKEAIIHEAVKQVVKKKKDGAEKMEVKGPGIDEKFQKDPVITPLTTTVTRA